MGPGVGKDMERAVDRRERGLLEARGPERPQQRKQVAGAVIFEFYFKQDRKPLEGLEQGHKVMSCGFETCSLGTQQGPWVLGRDPFPWPGQRRGAGDTQEDSLSWDLSSENTRETQEHLPGEL